LPAAGLVLTTRPRFTCAFLIDSKNMREPLAGWV